MSNQIKIFKKNKIDLQNTNVSITITDSVASDTGVDIADFVRNRNNRSAWVTTGSTDSGTTTLTVDFGDYETVGHLIFIKHNWKSFTVKYWDGFAYQDFSTPISETVNSDTSTYYNFTEVSASKLQIIITGTQIADSDKELYQLIVGEELGEFEAWPEIKRPTHVSNKKKNLMLSGKMNLVEPIGRFSVQLAVKFWNIDADLSIIESLYFSREPYLIWLCGGDENQFSTKRIGYRMEDIFLMRPTNDYVPEYVKSVYTNGLKVTIKLDEVLD